MAREDKRKGYSKKKSAKAAKGTSKRNGRTSKVKHAKGGPAKRPLHTAAVKNGAMPSFHAKERPLVRALFYIALFVSIFSIFFFPYLYVIGKETLAVASANSSIGLSLFFPLVVFAYMLAKGKSLKEIIFELGLSRKAFHRKALYYGLATFIALIFLEFGISAFQALTHIALPTNVALEFNGMPLYFFVFAVVVAPIDEEILFRGFMVPRIGIILSALIFGFLHYLSYASVSEFVAAFVFGLIAGYALKKTKSLYSTILPHILINLIGMIALLL